MVLTWQANKSDALQRKFLDRREGAVQVSGVLGRVAVLHVVILLLTLLIAPRPARASVSN